MNTVKRRRNAFIITSAIIVICICSFILMMMDKKESEKDIQEDPPIQYEDDYGYYKGPITMEMNYTFDLPVMPEEDVKPTWREQLNAGHSVINTWDGATLVKNDLPSKYYPGIDFSTFMPFEDIRCITDKSSPAYHVCHNADIYTDEYGLVRKVAKGFTVNNQNDYLIALGNYYKNKGEVGNRFLITTTTGYFTAVVGDEKADKDTDRYNMFGQHGEYAGMIEFIVDTNSLRPDAKRTGTITYSGNPVFKGEITGIYEIQ